MKDFFKAIVFVLIFWTTLIVGTVCMIEVIPCVMWLFGVHI
jgi:hypothetical protein